jgi:diguanylate cyclase (GGDEF)-like protein/PAS domain S-box-containing protein
MERALAGFDATFEATHYFGGQRHDLLLSYRPDRGTDGRVQGFVLLVTDQTEQRQIRRELKQGERQLRTLTELLPSTIWTASPTGELTYISSQFREVTGLSEDAGLGSGWTAIVHPEDCPAVVEFRETALRTGQPLEMQCRVRHRDGGYRWNLIRAVPEQNEAGDVTRWLGIATDIHAQVLGEQAARESERRYRLLFEDNPLPMFTYHTKTLQILSANDLAVMKYGYSREELLGLKITEIRSVQDIVPLLPYFHEPPEGSPIGPVRHRRKDGTAFWVEVTCHSLSGEDEDVRLLVAQDVSEKVRLHAELVRRADYDPLTGLPNRRILVEHFGRAVVRAKEMGQRVAVLAIDFDRFKQVNDTFGHKVGDEFLKASAQRLLSALPESDTLARVGGDEFTVLADCLDSSEECLEIVDKLIASLNEPVTIEDFQLRSSISVGIAFYPDHGEDFEEIHRRADFGMYHAKRSGGACWSCYSKLETQGIEESMEIERSLREAIREGRFELHYQPIISPGKDIRKLEALLRFPHPKLGLLPPARFIPVAEESGLIVPMGLWVLREACRQLRQWRKEGLDVVPVAVNVSAAQFRRGNLASDITEILEEFEVEPELLEIELTESLLMENTESSWQHLRLLKRAGVSIAVDDFGTGYSSLSYLHHLPLNRLKIDASFVREMISGGTKPIVRAIVELAKALRLSVIAEGVETDEQFLELAEMGCDLFQGFLFSAPKRASEIAPLLVKQPRRTGVVVTMPMPSERELLI